MNVKNLDKLATYLEGLPFGYSHFDMQLYIDGQESLPYLRCEENFCGTAACALGHGPAAGICYTGTNLFADWEGYAAKFTDRDALLWVWLFNDEWRHTDNTHQGAAARIRYVLDGKKVPPYFEDPFYIPDEDDVALYAEYLK
jgi:hypothetical protein